MIPEDTTNQQEATTSDSSSTPESETFTTLIAWGANHRGQLGNGTTTDSSTPVEVSDLVGVRDTAAGQDYSLALKDDGTVWAWGVNSLGELGNGTTTDSSTPVQVKDPNDPSGYLSGVQALDVSNFHSLALKDDGTVWAWGDNRCGGPAARWISGQLGDDEIASSSTPVEVGGLPSGVKAIAAGQCHSLALKDDGTVWAWGANLRGELGNSTIPHHSSTPVEACDLPSGIEAITAGFSGSLAIKDDGTVWAWGGIRREGVPTPVQVSEVGWAKAVAAGLSHSLAVVRSSR